MMHYFCMLVGKSVRIRKWHEDILAIHAIHIMLNLSAVKDYLKKDKVL